MSGLPQWQQALLHLLLQNAFLQLYLPLLSAVSYDPEFSMTTHSEHLPPLPFLTTFSSCHSRLTLKSSSFTLLTLFQTDLIPLHSFTDSQISLLHWPLSCCSASHLNLSEPMQMQTLTFPPMPCSLWLSIQIAYKNLPWKNVRVASKYSKVMKQKNQNFLNKQS